MSVGFLLDFKWGKDQTIPETQMAILRISKVLLQQWFLRIMAKIMTLQPEERLRKINVPRLNRTLFCKTFRFFQINDQANQLITALKKSLEEYKRQLLFNGKYCSVICRKTTKKSKRRGRESSKLLQETKTKPLSLTPAVQLPHQH